MSKIPEILFRYRSWTSVLRKDGNGGVTERNYTKESLENGTFHFSSPRDFDDLHDSLLGPHATGSPLDIDRFILHHKDLFALMRERGLGSITQLDTLKDEAAQKVFAPLAGHEARRHSRVLCFAEEMNNELMWATYANYHRGICLGFDASVPFFTGIQPVQYVDAPTAEAIASKASGTLIDPWSLCKSKAWEFQKEWRLVLPGDAPKRVGFPKEALKVVVLGYRFTERDFDELKEVFIRGGYRVQIFRIERVPGTFELANFYVGEIAGRSEAKENPPTEPSAR
ncbi:MAG TPA: DUF2971 domain-containing protein [Candidatus Limnocylindria bacterium]|nr:DUF2971 domain-containing protein [Candidatus Limnocylindria bacterium]